MGLVDTATGLRIAAARAIGALGDPGGAAVLALRLTFGRDELPEVLVQCMDALVALKELRLQELLAPMLESPHPYVVAGAATALADGCGAGAVPLLMDALDRVAADAREAIVYALAGIRDRRGGNSPGPVDPTSRAGGAQARPDTVPALEKPGGFWPPGSCVISAPAQLSAPAS